MTNHTPGPWRQHTVDETLIVTAIGPSKEIARVIGDYDSEANIMDANARLMVLAPDLLKALDAHEEADRLDDEFREMCERSDAEGWDKETGESHLNSFYRHVIEAQRKARELRATALAKVGAVHDDCF